MDSVKVLPTQNDDSVLRDTHSSGGGSVTATKSAGTNSDATTNAANQVKTTADTNNHRKPAQPHEELHKDGGGSDNSSQEYVYIHKPDQQQQQQQQQATTTSTTKTTSTTVSASSCSSSNNNNKVDGNKINSNAASSDTSDTVGDKTEAVGADQVTVDVEVHQESPKVIPRAGGGAEAHLQDRGGNSSGGATGGGAGAPTAGNTSAGLVRCATAPSSASPRVGCDPRSTSSGRGRTTASPVGEGDGMLGGGKSCETSCCDTTNSTTSDQNTNPDVKNPQNSYGGARPKLQIQPRRVQYQKHDLLQSKRDPEGLSVLEAYLKEQELLGMRRHSRDSTSSCEHMSHADLMHKRRSLPFVPRTSQYEKNPLLQERTESGLSQVELFLMEKEHEQSAADKRAQFKKAYSMQDEALNAAARQQNSPQPSTSQKLVPRGATSERHHLLKKTASGLSELEMLLLDKEREYEARRRSLDTIGACGGQPQRLLPRTEQYEKNVLLETITGEGSLLLEEVLSDTAAATASATSGANTDRESLLDPTSSLRQKRSSSSSGRRVHFDPSSVCEESDDDQRDESDRLLDHPSTDSSCSTSSGARRKKSGTARSKHSTGLGGPAVLEGGELPPGLKVKPDADVRSDAVNTKAEGAPAAKGCCVLS